MHRKINRETAKREKETRERLQKEYATKLNEKIQEHEQALKKKKLDLELEIQRKMKQVLK